MPQRYTKTCSRIDCVGWWINSCYLLTCLSMSPSPTVTKERFGNLCQDWVRSDECSSASKIHLLGKFQNILKWQQCTSVYSHTQGGVKTLTSWPAGWLWSSEWLRPAVLLSVCCWWMVAGSWLQSWDSHWGHLALRGKGSMTSRAHCYGSVCLHLHNTHRLRTEKKKHTKQRCLQRGAVLTEKNKNMSL